MDISTHTPKGVNKTDRYGWTTKDEPGRLEMLNKEVLQIHPAYQREVIPLKVTQITANWSWVGLGAIVVAERSGEFWVIDGQHRVLAAKRRSDITHLPCVVFKTSDIKQEARGFVDLNTGRKPVTILAKMRAMKVAGDAISIYVTDICEALGLEIVKNAKHVGQIGAVGWMMTRASEDKERFCACMELASELSRADSVPVSGKLLAGLWYINANVPMGLADKRLSRRIREKGAIALVLAATKASAYFAGGGDRVFADGMLSELNKGLQNKFSFRDATKGD